MQEEGECGLLGGALRKSWAISRKRWHFSLMPRWFLSFSAFYPCTLLPFPQPPSSRTAWNSPLLPNCLCPWLSSAGPPNSLKRKQGCVMAKNMGFWVGLTWIWNSVVLLTMWLWANYLISWNLSFHTFEMVKIKASTSQDGYKDSKRSCLWSTWCLASINSWNYDIMTFFICDKYSKLYIYKISFKLSSYPHWAVENLRHR